VIDLLLSDSDDEQGAGVGSGWHSKVKRRRVQTDFFTYTDRDLEDSAWVRAHDHRISARGLDADLTSGSGGEEEDDEDEDEDEDDDEDDEEDEDNGPKSSLASKAVIVIDLTMPVNEVPLAAVAAAPAVAEDPSDVQLIAIIPAPLQQVANAHENGEEDHSDDSTMDSPRSDHSSDEDYATDDGDDLDINATWSHSAAKVAQLGTGRLGYAVDDFCMEGEGKEDA